MSALVSRASTTGCSLARDNKVSRNVQSSLGKVVAARVPTFALGIRPESKEFRILKGVDFLQPRYSRTQAAASETVPQGSTPTPIIKIDNLSDPFGTILSVEYGKLTGEVLDTITALKNLNLNIQRAKLAETPTSIVNTFILSDSHTSEKITKSSRLEEIRLTVLNTLMDTYPESASALGRARVVDGAASPLGPRPVVPTSITVSDTPTGAASVLKIATPDRPGLLVDIVRVLKDINLNVVSAEVDTVGDQARDEFFVTYHGEALPTPMQTLVTNALQYYLSLNEMATDESY